MRDSNRSSAASYPLITEQFRGLKAYESRFRQLQLKVRRRQRVLYCAILRLISPLRWRSGCNSLATTKAGREIVVSLTSIPRRYHLLHLCLETLLSQKLKPSRIVLWLSDSQGPVPYYVERLQKRGLEIRFRPDLGPLTKIFYALKEFPEAVVVTADDDIIYPPSWLEALLRTHEEHPICVACHRAHEMILDEDGYPISYNAWKYRAYGERGPSLSLFATGVGGVLYPPGSLHSEVLDCETFLESCPRQDDVWLKVMSLRVGASVVKVGAHSGDIVEVPGSQVVALHHDNVAAGANDEPIRLLFRKWNIRHFVPEDLMTTGSPSYGSERVGNE